MLLEPLLWLTCVAILLDCPSRQWWCKYNLIYWSFTKERYWESSSHTKFFRVSLCASCLVSHQVNSCFVMRFVSLLATSSFASRYALRVSARTKWVHASFWTSKLWLKSSIPNADFSGRIPFHKYSRKISTTKFPHFHFFSFVLLFLPDYLW